MLFRQNLWGHHSIIAENPQFPYPLIQSIARTLFTQEEILNRVPIMWLILAGVLFVCFLPGYFVIGKFEIHPHSSQPDFVLPCYLCDVTDKIIFQ